jgi:hypothetical protein
MLKLELDASIVSRARAAAQKITGALTGCSIPTVP